MTNIPETLLTAFADVNEKIISEWWSTLSPERQMEVEKLCDTRLDTCFFGIIEDSNAVIPKVHGGRFTQLGGDGYAEQWSQEYFEHLLDHQELVIVYDHSQHKFHTGCIQHPVAKACWSNGQVSENFTCPFKTDACLMTPFKGRAIRRVT